MPSPAIGGSGTFSLQIHEIFLSIQGEGVHTGAPSVFVRTAGCDHSCKWCDTPEAQNPETGRAMSFPELMREIRRYDTVSRVCLTGGEPLQQANAKMFVQMLLNEGYFVDLETNGAHFIGDVPTHEKLTLSMDVKTPSSGMKERTRLDNLSYLGPKDQVKFVIGDDEDMEYSATVVRRHDLSCPIILTPVDGLDMRPLIEKVLASPAWKKRMVRTLPQLHKVVWGKTRGV
jgi:7-carboxy-7-deazaguanine synthase